MLFLTRRPSYPDRQMYVHSLLTKELLKTAELPDAVLSLSPAGDGSVEVLTDSPAVLQMQLPSLRETFRLDLGKAFRQLPDPGVLSDARLGRRDEKGKVAGVVCARRGEGGGGGGVLSVSSHGSKAKATLGQVAPSSPLGARPLFDCNRNGHVALVLARGGDLATFRGGEKGSRRTFKCVLLTTCSSIVKNRLVGNLD